LFWQRRLISWVLQRTASSTEGCCSASKWGFTVNLTRALWRSN
jgi:hypothetical protein